MGGTYPVQASGIPDKAGGDLFGRCARPARPDQDGDQLCIGQGFGALAQETISRTKFERHGSTLPLAAVVGFRPLGPLAGFTGLGEEALLLTAV